MPIKGKYFMIVSKTTGLVLDVRGQETSPGSEVIMYEKTGNDNQVWYDDPLTGTCRGKQSNLCLDFNSEQLFYLFVKQKTLFFSTEVIEPFIRTAICF